MFDINNMFYNSSQFLHCGIGAIVRGRRLQLLFTFTRVNCVLKMRIVRCYVPLYFYLT